MRDHALWWLMFFFFSSRRRHTRFDCDWSSDVCSSDLSGSGTLPRASTVAKGEPAGWFDHTTESEAGPAPTAGGPIAPRRSEERRVGEEGRSRWAPDSLKKKKRRKEMRDALEKNSR